MNYVDPFGGSPVNPAEVSYQSITIDDDTTLSWPSLSTNTTPVVSQIMEVTASTTSLSLAMPPANQAATGEDVLIRNMGANTFTITDYDGNTITTVTSGSAKYVYLTDNSTASGVWTAIAFGVGSSVVDAAALVGYGIIASGATLNQAHEVTTVATSYSIITSDRSRVIIDSVGVTLSLPSAATVGSNWFVMVKNSSSGTTTVDPAGADTIDGAATLTLNPDESMLIVSTGAVYFSVGRGRSNVFSFTQLTKALSDGTTTLTAAEFANKILYFTHGTETAATTIVLPNTVTIWFVFNYSNFSTTVKTAAGAGIVIPANGSAIVYGDGTDVVNAVTVSTPTVTFGSGSAAAPSITFTGDSDTGVYNPAANQLGFAVGGVNVATLSSSTLNVPALTTVGVVTAGSLSLTTEYISATTHAATSKATPVDADEIPLLDSVASFAIKQLTWANIKATLKTYFDTLYAASAGIYAAKGANSDITSLSALTAPTVAANPVRATDLQNQTGKAYTTAGTSTAFTVTAAPALTSYVANQELFITLHTAPGSNPTINWNGLGAKDFKYYDAVGTKQFVTSSVAPSGWVSNCYYDGMDVIMMNILPTTSSLNVKIISFTRNISLASGTQAVTGVGFMPKLISFVTCVPATTGRASWGFDDGTTHMSLLDTHTISADTYQPAMSFSLYCVSISGAEYKGVVNSFDADGFTIGWTKTGAPTGTMTIIAKCVG